jgi:hypothetical protein
MKPRDRLILGRETNLTRESTELKNNRAGLDWKERGTYGDVEVGVR